ncbi:MAG: hypothetical protein HUU10_02280 [Bacteroidetes bacterium]|nr:hypothetical protein [Bacteroidota bacterium]
MKKSLLYSACLIALFLPVTVAAQSTYGDALNRAKNIHQGNKVRVTIHNNGRLGSVRGDASETYPGEWPIGTGQIQLGNTSQFVMSEVRVFSHIDATTGDSVFKYLTPAIFGEGWDPSVFSSDSLGRFLGFEPLPGYLNLTQKAKNVNRAVAMSNQPFTWPAFWPDKTSDGVDAGWAGKWNGYFGKDQYNADEESYFVVDDYVYKKRLKGLNLPLPIPSEPGRGGLGLKMSIRGLQWANPDAEDVVFWLFRIQNISQRNLDRTVFGENVGASSGALIGGGGGNENSDDAALFYREEGLAVNYDIDNRGAGGYTPVPYVGFAFLESPGNGLDGIDNDGDGIDPTKPGGGTGKVISVGDFAKTYRIGQQIVTINYNNPAYPRTLTTMPMAGVEFKFGGITHKKMPNQMLIEIPRNGVDDNLNGLIDESDGAKVYDPDIKDSVEYFLYIRSDYNKRDYLAIDYFTGSGLNNRMIDERRDDGIDNDGDWDIRFDDVGLDGKVGTGDEGEGDGRPTPGNNDLPGEPNIDRVDVDESDQIGLTSFKFYVYGALTYSNDDQMWAYSNPGFFDFKTTVVADHDYVFSSGYFPLKAGREEFFSVALLFGVDEFDIIRNKRTVQEIYNSNYNFAVAPLQPTLSAVAGDKKVTLYWDEEAEASYDRFLKTYDFEGYKLYKSSWVEFNEDGDITDGYGISRYNVPIAIWDKVDSVFGFFPQTGGTGVQFNLGSETGLEHRYVDTDVQNGVQYFYGLTAYDTGDIEKNIGPSECVIYIARNQAGEISYSQNVVAVTPTAPSAGFESAGFDINPRPVGELKTAGVVGINIIDPAKIRDGDRYEIGFLDPSNDKLDNDKDGVLDDLDLDEFFPTETSGFWLKNVSQASKTDTVYLVDRIGDSIVVRNLYDDRDGDPHTFSKLMNDLGLEVVVRNPMPGVYNNPDEGIFKGVKWGNNVNPADSAYILRFTQYDQGGFKKGTPYPRQYEIRFYNQLVDTSSAIRVPLATGTGSIPLPGRPVNFKVYDKQTGEELKFAFTENANVQPKIAPAGFFSAKDRIIFFEELSDGRTVITNQLLNVSNNDTLFNKIYGRILGEGDNISLYPDNPFYKLSRYEFTVRAESVNNKAAKAAMKNIRVVPNPYVVTAIWEHPSATGTGRGERKVEFTNLPKKCTIRIFTVDGNLVRVLEHDAPASDGSEPWDLRSKDNMEVAYGVYIYHVEAPGVGNHIGRMIVIK